MKNCRRCQKRSSKPTCKECVKLRDAEWKKNNPEKVRAAKRRWDAKNKERVRESNRLWRFNNKEKKLKSRRLWDANNVEKVRAGRRRFYKNNPESVLRSRLKKSYRLELEDFQQIRLNQQNCCAICRLEFKKTPHVDHCHRTGKIRGLLCTCCNISLGGFKDSPNLLIAAAEYLDKSHHLK